MPPMLVAVATWIYVLVVIALVLLALFRRREPAAALGWSLAIVFLPFVGLFLFIVFGLSRTPRRLERKKRHHETFRERFGVTESERERRRRAGAQPLPRRRWAGLSTMLDRLGGSPRRTGNRLQVFDEGVAAFEAMRAAVLAARHHVHVEFFIFRRDELGARAIDLLVQKCREGVEVRVILDGVGSPGNRRILGRIERAGGRGAVFLPFAFLGKRVTPNLRNHRKIVICDGEVAFFGGLNVGTEYLGAWRRERSWLDLHAELRGPAVSDLQEVFAEDWDFCTGEMLVDPAYYPLTGSAGESGVQIVAGGPDEDVNSIRAALIAAFARARRSIHVMSPYLVPDPTIRDALQIGARSGVDVRILTQWPPVDHAIVQLCGEYYMQDLLAAGARILGYEPGMMHAKAVIVDDEWAMLGTANLDNRSLSLNFELMAVLDAPRDIRRLAEVFARVEAGSRPYTLEGLAARPAARRALSQASRLLAPLF